MKTVKDVSGQTVKYVVGLDTHFARVGGTDLNVHPFHRFQTRMHRYPACRTGFDLRFPPFSLNARKGWCSLGPWWSQKTNNRKVGQPAGFISLSFSYIDRWRGTRRILVSLEGDSAKRNTTPVPALLGPGIASNS